MFLRSLISPDVEGRKASSRPIVPVIVGWSAGFGWPAGLSQHKADNERQPRPSHNNLTHAPRPLLAFCKAPGPARLLWCAAATPVGKEWSRARGHHV